MRRILQLALLLLLLVHVAGPLFEDVDHWDGVAGGGDDFVLSALDAIAGLGLTVLLGFLLQWVVSILRASWALNPGIISQPAGVFLESAKPVALTIPPLPLRI